MVGMGGAEKADRAALHACVIFGKPIKIKDRKKAIDNQQLKMQQFRATPGRYSFFALVC